MDCTGEKITPKHVYANPYEPHKCPILALALHIFGAYDRSQMADIIKVFPSLTTFDTFSKWLNEALKAVSNLGFSPDDYGTHSFRKGVATFVSGETVCLVNS